MTTREDLLAFVEEWKRLNPECYSPYYKVYLMEKNNEQITYNYPGQKDPINGIIAGGIIAALGESSVYLFEQIFLGKRHLTTLIGSRNLLNRSSLHSSLVKCRILLKNLPKIRRKNWIYQCC